MPVRSSAAVNLDVGFALDRRWHALRREAVIDKRDALLSLIRVLDEASVEWAVIGGMALQVRAEEPRTTVDIDIVVRDRRVLPAPALTAAGFGFEGHHPHRDNWRSADGVPVQFADDPLMTRWIASAERVPLGSLTLPVVTAAALVAMKLRSAVDPARRRSKRAIDLADVLALLERHPELEAGLSEEDRALLSRLPGGPET